MTSAVNDFRIWRWEWGDIRRDNPESQVCQCCEDWGDWILWRLTNGGVCRLLLASAHGVGTWGEWGTRSRIPVIFYCLKKCECDEDLYKIYQTYLEELQSAHGVWHLGHSYKWIDLWRVNRPCFYRSFKSQFWKITQILPLLSNIALRCSIQFSNRVSMKIDSKVHHLV